MTTAATGRHRLTGSRSALLSGPIWPPLLRLATPNMIGVLAMSMIGIVEAWYVGQLGRTALAGVALVFPVMMLQGMLSAGAIGGAVAGATARAMGADDRAQAEAVLRTAILIALGGTITMGLLFIGLGAPIYRLLGGDGDVLAAALAYSDLLFGGIVSVWLFNMLSSVLRGAGDMARPAVGMVLVTAVHAACAAVTIPALGMRGAALAIVLAYGVGTAVLLGFLWSGRGAVALRLRGPLPRPLVAQILRAGALAGSQSLVTIATFLMITAVIGRLGAAALAGYGIGARIEILMIPVIFGFGGAMIAMCGANVGAGQRERAIAIAWRGSCASALVVGGIGLFLSIVPAAWSELFTDDAEVRAITRLYLQIVGPAYGFFGLGLAAYFASQGLRSLLYPVLAAWLRFALIGAGFLVLAAAGHFTAIGAFAVVALAMVLYGSFVAITLSTGPWRQRPIPA